MHKYLVILFFLLYCLSEITAMEKSEPLSTSHRLTDEAASSPLAKLEKEVTDILDSMEALHFDQLAFLTEQEQLLSEGLHDKEFFKGMPVHLIGEWITYALDQRNRNLDIISTRRAQLHALQNNRIDLNTFFGTFLQEHFELLGTAFKNLRASMELKKKKGDVPLKERAKMYGSSGAFLDDKEYYKTLFTDGVALLEVLYPYLTTPLPAELSSMLSCSPPLEHFFGKKLEMFPDLYSQECITAAGAYLNKFYTAALFITTTGERREEFVRKENFKDYVGLLKQMPGVSVIKEDAEKLISPKESEVIEKRVGAKLTAQKKVQKKEDRRQAKKEGKKARAEAMQKATKESERRNSLIKEAIKAAKEARRHQQTQPVKKQKISTDELSSTSLTFDTSQQSSPEPYVIHERPPKVKTRGVTDPTYEEKNQPLPASEEMKAEPEVQTQPTLLHTQKYKLLEKFWELPSGFAYDSFITLFEGLGGRIITNKGGSSHFRMEFTRKDGITVVDGSCVPKPTLVYGYFLLRKLHKYFTACGLTLENYIHVIDK